MPMSANDPSLSRAARLLKLLEQDNSDLTGRSQPGARPFLSALQPLPLVARNRLRKVCDRWDFWYHGKELPGKDCRGMHLLNILLHSPHEDFHVLNLMQLVTRGKAVGDLTLHGNLPAQLLAQEGLVI